MNTILGVLPLHRTAVAASVDAVSAVTLDQLANRTPCADWNLADLIAHMVVQNRGFAAAARGNGADLPVWDPATAAGEVALDPVTAYADSATEVLDAFAADGVSEMEFALPDFGPGATFPAAIAIGFHFVDYVVHGWDVARSVGATFELPKEVVAAVLPLALAVPDGAFRSAAASPFHPAIAVDGRVDDMDRVLTHLGRSPGWTAH
jgi:uncharacterized protein (TIGR03086 family)